MPALDGTITFATSEYRPCLVKGQHALFHRWEDNSEIYAPSVMIGGHGGGDRQIRKMRKILHTRNGRLEIAVELRGGFCILQSAVWPRAWFMGRKGVQRSKDRNNDRPSYSVANGYGIFSRLYIRKSGNPFRTWPPDIHGRRRQATIKRQRETRASAFPVNGCYL